MMDKRVFIIEDEEDILDILSSYFTDLGYRVETARDSNVIDRIIKFLPDVILLDLRLHNSPKTGLEVCTELKRHPLLSVLPVIFLSAEFQLEEFAKKCGADDFIQKPFELKELHAKVTQYL